jgi:hypothetical protein
MDLVVTSLGLSSHPSVVTDKGSIDIAYLLSSKSARPLCIPERVSTHLFK